jgi:prepilin-type N-terminal cleavage/methylation domain-containing protein
MISASRLHGFTLVEVLIASVIFFSAIAVATQAYSVSMIADAKARDVVSMLGPVPLIVQKIQSEIRENPTESMTGDGRLLGVDYRFEAVQVRFEPPPPRFDPDTAEFREYPNRFKLYDVRLSLAFGQSERAFVYQEWAWLSPQGK